MNIYSHSGYQNGNLSACCLFVYISRGFLGVAPTKFPLSLKSMCPPLDQNIKIKASRMAEWTTFDGP